jgi:hypothetical protein
MTLTSQPTGPVESWPIVECDGQRWHVAPVYCAPVARRDVEGLCDAWGCEVPTSALVDAIWRAADVRLNPMHLMRNYRLPADMVAYAEQQRTIDREVARALDGRADFTLLAGTHKDFARMPDGRVDLYGWHRPSGKCIEPGRTSHNADYIDYSQGLRLVRLACAQEAA